jgi:hypothetical protein
VSIQQRDQILDLIDELADYLSESAFMVEAQLAMLSRMEDVHPSVRAGAQAYGARLHKRAEDLQLALNQLTAIRQ